MISALGDCVPVLQQVKHEESPQVMLDTFEKEISDTLHEVSLYTNTTKVNSLCCWGDRRHMMKRQLYQNKLLVPPPPPSSKIQLCGTV